jgi:hypothetical protein
MPEVSGVEYNFENKCYVAIFTNGDTCELESNNLREAELEAERIADQNSFASFTAPGRDW